MDDNNFFPEDRDFFDTDFTAANRLGIEEYNQNLNSIDQAINQEPIFKTLEAVQEPQRYEQKPDLYYQFQDQENFLAPTSNFYADLAANTGVQLKADGLSLWSNDESEIEQKPIIHRSIEDSGGNGYYYVLPPQQGDPANMSLLKSESLNIEEKPTLRMEMRSSAGEPYRTSTVRRNVLERQAKQVTGRTRVSSGGEEVAHKRKYPKKQNYVSFSAEEYSFQRTPNAIYIALLSGLAFLNSKADCLSLRELYAFICEHFEGFDIKCEAWKKSIRHSLCTHSDVYDKAEGEGNWKLINKAAYVEKLNNYCAKHKDVKQYGLKNIANWEKIRNGRIGIPHIEPRPVNLGTSNRRKATKYPSLFDEIQSNQLYPTQSEQFPYEEQQMGGEVQQPSGQYQPEQDANYYYNYNMAQNPIEFNGYQNYPDMYQYPIYQPNQFIPQAQQQYDYFSLNNPAADVNYLIAPKREEGDQKVPELL